MEGRTFWIYGAGYLAFVVAAGSLMAAFIVVEEALSDQESILGWLLVSPVLALPMTAAAVVFCLPGYLAIRASLKVLALSGVVWFALGGAFHGAVLYFISGMYRPGIGVADESLGALAIAKLFLPAAMWSSATGVAAWFGERWMRQWLGDARDVGET